MKIYWIKFIIKISVLTLCFVHLLNSQVTDTIQMVPGWNLVSIPLKVQDYHRLVLFPNAVSWAFRYYPAFGYQGESDDILRNGEGYFIKYNDSDCVIISGLPIMEDTINVAAGWNMIGTISYAVSISQVFTQPADIIISDFYKYQDDFYYSVDSLKPGHGYWVKVNQPGNLILTSMGYPCPGIPTVEYAGKTYNTVKIGIQCWLKENLDVGVRINGNQNSSDNGAIEKYCYNNDPSNCNTYGGLYQWKEAMQYIEAEGAQGICPSGWHIPSYVEFQTLINTVSGDGNSLKAIGQGTGAGVGTNTNGYSALLAGGREYDGSFLYQNYWTFFWSSSGWDYPPSGAEMNLTYNNENINLFKNVLAEYGLSIRCIKD